MELKLVSILVAVVCILYGRSLTVEGEVLNDEDAKDLVDAHNDFRRLENGANMNLIKWDVELAKDADTYSEECAYEHGGVDDNARFSSVGQNIYLVKPQQHVNPKTATLKWGAEKKNYNFETQGCKGTCGHYTQLVWADTIYVGCAVRNCSTVTPNNIADATLLICNYGPGGNFPGSDPYVPDTPCSMCQEGNECIDGLCDADYE